MHDNLFESYPSRLIVPTKMAYLEFKRRMSTLSQVEFNADEVGEFIIESLCSKRDLEHNKEALVAYFTQQFEDTSDQAMAGDAISRLHAAILAQLEPLNPWTLQYELGYRFERWIMGDMALRRLPV